MTAAAHVIINADALRDDPPTCDWKVEARTKDSRGKISNIVAAIRALRAARGLGLKEAKDTVEAYAAIVMTAEPYVGPVKVAPRYVDLPGDGGTLVLKTQCDGTVDVSFTFNFGTVAADKEVDAAVQLSHRLRSLSRQLVKYRSKIGCN
jgi:Ribosomal protein L7/L12